MRKPVYLIFLLLAAPMLLQGQNSEEAKVTEVISQLFRGMYKADSTLVRASFTSEVTMATAMKNKEGVAVLKRESSINGFVKSVGSQKPGALSEEIWGLKIQIDGDLAQVWCDYAFYYNNQFSHCGVDAFQLYKTKEGWKIFHLSDTRRKDGCNIPEEVQKKYKQ
jgi:hypothetical protein